VAYESRRRVLLAKPGLDGHDRGVKVVARALRDDGFEVIYTGLHQTVEAIVAAAVAEDVDLIGLSVLSGAHVAYTRDIRAHLDKAGASDIPIIIGGIIPSEDEDMLRSAGAAAIFPTGFNILELGPSLRSMLAEVSGSEGE
jgi:methylmalonyl-CoA mutase, C-terminal domain